MFTEKQQIPAILERFVQTYPTKKRFAYELLPLFQADIARDSYKVAQFSADHLSVGEFERGYAEESQRNSNDIRSWAVVQTKRYTLESAVDRAEVYGASDAFNSSLLIRESRLQKAYDKLINSFEVAQAEMLLNPTPYGVNTMIPSADEKWNLTHANPIAMIAEAMQKIKRATGKKPNKFVISEPVWQALRKKADLLDLMPVTSLKAGLTPEDFAHIIEVEKVIVCDHMHYANDGLTYTWGNSAILAYVPDTMRSLEDLSFGVTVRSPLGYNDMRDYYDEKTSSDVTAIDEKIGWAVANYQAGFLFQDLLG